VTHGSPLRQNGSRHRHEVALTFDDGPAPDTPAFLGVLEREHVPATFFEVGQQVSGRGALLKRILGDGDVVGNHSLTHPDLVRAGPARAAFELARASAIIHANASYRPCLFRAPYGSLDRSLVARAQADGMATIEWDVDPRDWSRPGTAAIESRVLSGVRNGSIVLMHDGGGPRGETLAALPHIVAALRHRGYRLVTVLDLLGFHSVSPAG